MDLPIIHNCPGTLASGHETYSTTCLRRMYNGRRVSHILAYESPFGNEVNKDLFVENKRRISISGVQEKFSVLQVKNKLRLIQESEQGSHILKPIPSIGKNLNQIPANEHLTMQIASQVFDIKTAENSLIFFRTGESAYITKRFDIKSNGSKLAVEDFASLSGKTPQTHGENYKYQGNYLELFELLKKYLIVYKLEAPKLFSLLVFNYLFSNGDAHLKNFSLLETPLGDFSLSPAYDLLNTRIHIEDTDFALENGLLPPSLSGGKIRSQFNLLADKAGISKNQNDKIFDLLLSSEKDVEKLINASFLNNKIKRNYLQSYQTRLKKLRK